MADAKGPTAADFVASILPQYKGPLITLRLQPSNNEYVIPKTLLCAQSPVFSAMLNGQFAESTQGELILEEDADMVSVPSIEGLCQWLHQHTVSFGIKDPGDHISAIIQLLRLADKYMITGMESTMAQNVKNILKANPHPKNTPKARQVDTNTYSLKHDHIVSAIKLPPDHPLRAVLAAASVEGFLRSPQHKFAKEVDVYPLFRADLLREIPAAIRSMYSLNNGRTIPFRDPLSGNASWLN
ncbi:unnamed protein product [Penicillium olsonii]|nr:unnamed protein product [Penicillium olsonii]